MPIARPSAGSSTSSSRGDLAQQELVAETEIGATALWYFGLHAASKSALNTLTLHTAWDLRPYGIRVTIETNAPFIRTVSAGLNKPAPTQSHEKMIANYVARITASGWAYGPDIEDLPTYMDSRIDPKLPAAFERCNILSIAHIITVCGSICGMEFPHDAPKSLFIGNF